MEDVRNDRIKDVQVREFVSVFLSSSLSWTEGKTKSTRISRTLVSPFCPLVMSSLTTDANSWWVPSLLAMVWHNNHLFDMFTCTKAIIAALHVIVKYCWFKCSNQECKVSKAWWWHCNMQKPKYSSCHLINTQVPQRVKNAIQSDLAILLLLHFHIAYERHCCIIQTWIQGGPSGRGKPPVDLVPALLAAGGPLL